MNFTTLFLWIAGLIYVLTCLWLILVVLLQEGKSGGMANEGAASAPSAFTDSFGAGGAQKNLFRMTAGTALVFFVLAIALTHLGAARSHKGGTLQLPTGQQVEQVAPDVTTDESLPGAGTAEGTAAPAGEIPPAEEAPEQTP